MMLYGILLATAITATYSSWPFSSNTISITDFGKALKDGECERIVTGKKTTGDLLHTTGNLICKSGNTVNSKHFEIVTYVENTNSANSGWPLEDVTFTRPVQSPVDIITSKAVLKNLPKLQFNSLSSTGVKSKVYNSGHTVYVYMKGPHGERPYVTGGPLRNQYKFEQMHIHWGTTDIWGSEHFIDGESYSTEMHAVHFNAKYGTYEQACNKTDGLAVVTAFAEATTEENVNLRPLEELLPNITKAKSYVDVPSDKSLAWLSTAFTTNTDYYTYPGSLTTEPYTENVIWIVLPKPLTMSHTQLGCFRELHGEAENTLITENKRQLQPLFGRPIARSINI